MAINLRDHPPDFNTANRPQQMPETRTREPVTLA
jgi:hypothetical protein